MGFDPSEPRDPHSGKWVKHVVPHTDVVVGDRLDIGGKTRVSKVFRRPGEDFTRAQTKTLGARSPGVHHFSGDSTVFRQKAGGPSKSLPIYASDLSTPDARRSPEVSEPEFQSHVNRGKAKYAQLDNGRSGPMALEGAQFKRVTDEAYDATREEWGGITVDSHTGEHVAVDADKYALTIRKQGTDSVTVDPAASREDFDNAMGEARKRFAYELSFPGAHLGVFHDADLGRIDIDPVLVTPSLSDVHDIGAFTRAVGGAYHFKSGDGFWPPHVKDKEKAMSLSFNTPTLRGGEYDLSAKDGKLAFWKQILPMKTIHYTAKDGTRQVLNFDREYLTDLASQKAVDKVGFLLADRDNAHTMDPERWRGEVQQMEVRDDGLYGKIVFSSVEAARAVLDNPDLGVSARIRENVGRSDGSTVPRGIIHVLGTLDPQVSGMSPWQATDLSASQDEVLDLSDKEYEDMSDKTETAAEKFANVTPADIDAMDETTLDEYLAFMGIDVASYTGDETDEHEDADKGELVGAGADMSNSGSDLDLARQETAAARAESREAMRRVAEAEWREERNGYMGEGVPAAALDLAAPVLNRASDMVIDLSNSGEDDVNVSAVIRGLLDSLKGTVDLSAESGHFGTTSGEDNPDEAILARWTIEG